jgi:hypothetical protein
MLFILAMEPFHRILKAAEDATILQPVNGRNARFRCPLYADDVAVFANPNSAELSSLSQILDFFAIRCDEIDLNNLLSSFPGMIKCFPCRYLGLPLHYRKLRKIDFIPLIDKIGSRLPGWKGRFFTSAGRKTLVHSVLSSIPIHHLTALRAPKWVFKRIDRFRRSFLWKRKDPDHTNPGDSLINWQLVFRPKSLGGLVFPTLKDSQGPCASAGCGFLGNPTTNLGLV